MKSLLLRGVALAGALALAATGVALAPAGASAPSASSSCTVKLGMIFAGGGSEAANEKGSGEFEASATDQQVEDMNQVAFDDINKSGGIGGCTAEPVYAVTSIASNDFAGQAQQACAKLTQDEKVFAVIGTTIPDGLATNCVVKAGTPVLLQGGQPLVDYAKAPKLLYNIYGIGLGRMNTLIPVWQGKGLLKKGTKVGIVWVDDPGGVQRTLVNKIWTPQLEKAGLEVTDFSLPFVNGNDKISTSISQMSSAVLQFKNAGITEVITTDAIPAFLFPIQANSQDYKPLILVSDAGGVPTALTGVIPQAAMGQIRSIGWSRADWDSTTVKNPAVKTNSAVEHCASIYEGVTLPAQQNGTPPYGICDALSFFQQALKGKKPTVNHLAAGVDALGTKFVAAGTLGPTRFAKGQHDGIMTVQNFTIDAASKESQPSGGLVTLKSPAN
jgi:ABC-type branched-subunit amino acid transport system substrate-binding protein